MNAFMTPLRIGIPERLPLQKPSAPIKVTDKCMDRARLVYLTWSQIQLQHQVAGTCWNNAQRIPSTFSLSYRNTQSLYPPTHHGTINSAARVTLLLQYQYHFIMLH